jgi:2-polyprenyl-3-methyl-5-hydroxy-6-metoxy-1,4-benzoquinol methylase
MLLIEYTGGYLLKSLGLKMNDKVNKNALFDSLRGGYFIKSSYHPRVGSGQKTNFIQQQDSVENSVIWQYEVYEYASRLIREYQLKSVLDIGCGCGMKLKKLIFPVCQDIVGIDEPNTIAWCKQHHDFGNWYQDNLEEPELDLGRTFDLIISADAIEHLINPDQLIKMINKYASKRGFIILSTPERDSLRGKDDIGPPQNPLHVREWSYNEFHQYIQYNRFNIIKHFRVDEKTPLSLQTQGKLHRRIVLVKTSLQKSVISMGNWLGRQTHFHLKTVDHSRFDTSNHQFPLKNKSRLRRKIRRLEQTLSGVMRGQNILLNGQVVLIKMVE